MLLAFGRSIFLDVTPFWPAVPPFFLGRFGAMFTRVFDAAAITDTRVWFYIPLGLVPTVVSLPLHGTKTVLALTVLASGCFFAYARSYVLSAVFVRHVSPWRCFVKALAAEESV